LLQRTVVAGLLSRNHARSAPWQQYRECTDQTEGHDPRASSEEDEERTPPNSERTSSRSAGSERVVGNQPDGVSPDARTSGLRDSTSAPPIELNTSSPTSAMTLRTSDPGHASRHSTQRSAPTVVSAGASDLPRSRALVINRP
jgi:hypothetical protein